MTEWGNNPATYQAIAAIVVALGGFAILLSALFMWQALRDIRSQREVIEQEMAVRMRPWVGMFGFVFDPNGRRGNTLNLELRNFGILPAQQASLSLMIRPLKPSNDDTKDTITRTERGEKVLLPNEKGSYTIHLADYPQFAAWRDARHDVQVEGAFSYALGVMSFKTAFEATIWFSEGAVANDANVRINWRNTAAS